MSKQKHNNCCTQHVLNLHFSGNSMNNILPYCGLTDARMRASEKDLPANYIFSDNISIMMRLFDQIETPQEARGLS